MFSLSALAANLMALGGETPLLREELKPLAGLLGKWELRAPGPDGNTISGTVLITAEAGGNAVTARSELVDSAGKVIFSRHAIYFWRQDSKTIIDVCVDSSGKNFSSVLVQSSHDKMVWQGTGMTDARDLGSHVIVMTHVNDNTWTWQMKNIVLAGDPLPDSGKSTLTRMK